MRTGVWFLVVAVGLIASSAANAQVSTFGASGTRSTGTRMANTVTPTSYVGSKFRLRDVFPSLNPFNNRNSVGRSNVPDTYSADYLKMFGYKRLY